MLAQPAWSHPDVLSQIESLDQQLILQPGDADLLIKRGDLYRRHQDFAAAKRDFDAARVIQPDNPLLDFYQGRLLLEMGEWDRSEQMLSRYLAEHPEHAAAWSVRASARLALERYIPAAEDFGQAIRHSKRATPTLYQSQALALVEAGKPAWPQALKIIDRGLELFPQEVSLLGLGTDIALASANPVLAQHYMDQLPPRLLTLPQWQQRLETNQCFEHLTGPEQNAGHCQ